VAFFSLANKILSALALNDIGSINQKSQTLLSDGSKDCHILEKFDAGSLHIYDAS
jgi:hypothetical protein